MTANVFDFADGGLWKVLQYTDSVTEADTHVFTHGIKTDKVCTFHGKLNYLHLQHCNTDSKSNSTHLDFFLVFLSKNLLPG